MANGFWTHGGTGSKYICLPETPTMCKPKKCHFMVHSIPPSMRLMIKCLAVQRITMVLFAMFQGQL